jgi:hypothetical protein
MYIGILKMELKGTTEVAESLLDRKRSKDPLDNSELFATMIENPTECRILNDLNRIK